MTGPALVVEYAQLADTCGKQTNGQCSYLGLFLSTRSAIRNFNFERKRTGALAQTLYDPFFPPFPLSIFLFFSSGVPHSGPSHHACVHHWYGKLGRLRVGRQSGDAWHAFSIETPSIVVPPSPVARATLASEHLPFANSRKPRDGQDPIV